MRQTQIFSGSSHPVLVNSICDYLGSDPGKAELGKFSNGETQVQIHTSVRNQDVFIVQSGSEKINDSVMELLIMIAACKSGCARSVTAVMPYFPYSRQSKKKSHRGSITARMVANLLKVAGIDHVITIDLHATQMQGFFHCPVDNLIAEPLIVQWIKMNIQDWRKACVVSKNPGGTKRVTALADALKISFGIVMTDRKRTHSGRTSMNNSMILPPSFSGYPSEQQFSKLIHKRLADHVEGGGESSVNGTRHSSPTNSSFASRRRTTNGTNALPSNLLQRNTVVPPPFQNELARIQTAPSTTRDGIDDEDDEDDDVDDPRDRDIVTGRLFHGHIVDENASSPNYRSGPGTPHDVRFNFRTRESHSHLQDSTTDASQPPNTSIAPSSQQQTLPHHSSSASEENEPDEIPDHMVSSFISNASSTYQHRSNHTLRDLQLGLGGSADAVGSSDDEEENLMNPDFESTVTLVGNVKDRTVFILDDMIDKSTSWIAAAETVVKRGGATKVWCMATHGLFGDSSLEELEACDCIDGILVTNSFPIPEAKRKRMEAKGRPAKLQIIDVSALLAEAVRRNRHGENISQLLFYQT